MMKESRGCCRCSDAATASCSGCNRKPVAPMNPAPGKTAYIATHILQTLSSRVSNSRILSAASPMYTCSCSDLQQTTKTKPHARCTPMRSHSGGWQACHCAKPPHPIVEGSQRRLAGLEQRQQHSIVATGQPRHGRLERRLPKFKVAAGRPHSARCPPHQRASRGSPALPAIQSCKISAASNASGHRS